MTTRAASGFGRQRLACALLNVVAWVNHHNPRILPAVLDNRPRQRAIHERETSQDDFVSESDRDRECLVVLVERTPGDGGLLLVTKKDDRFDSVVRTRSFAPQRPDRKEPTNGVL
jgi:hypothetical protein